MRILVVMTMVALAACNPGGGTAPDVAELVTAPRCADRNGRVFPSCPCATQADCEADQECVRRGIGPLSCQPRGDAGVPAIGDTCLQQYECRPYLTCYRAGDGGLCGVPSNGVPGQ